MIVHTKENHVIKQTCDPKPIIECNLRNNENFCNKGGGCTWTTQAEACTGTPTQCSSYFNEPSCTSQQSCLWGIEPQCNLDHTDETGKCNEYCNADPECDGVSPGTNNCNNNCKYSPPCTYQCTGELNPWQSSCSDRLFC